MVETSNPNPNDTAMDTVVPKTEPAVLEGSISSAVSTPEAEGEILTQDVAQTQKRKGGRKPVRKIYSLPPFILLYFFYFILFYPPCGVRDGNPGPRIAVIIIIAHYVSDSIDRFSYLCPPLYLFFGLFVYYLFLLCHLPILAYHDLHLLPLSS